MAVFDALIFLTVAGIISASITVAVMNKSENEELKTLRTDIDNSSSSLGIVQQFCIKETYYVDQTNERVPLEDKTILDLLEFSLVSYELNNSANVRPILVSIRIELDRTMNTNYLLRAEANVFTIDIPERELPDTVLATSSTSPAGPILGNVTLSLYTW